MTLKDWFCAGVLGRCILNHYVQRATESWLGLPLMHFPRRSYLDNVFYIKQSLEKMQNKVVGTWTGPVSLEFLAPQWLHQYKGWRVPSTTAD